MNKERAIEILKTIRHNSTMQTDYTIDDIDQALDIAIESLEQENLDISIDWLDEFISWAKHRVKTAYENYSDRIDIKINKNELSRIIKILEHYYKKVEPYERKE